MRRFSPSCTGIKGRMTTRGSSWDLGSLLGTGLPVTGLLGGSFCIQMLFKPQHMQPRDKLVSVQQGQ